jgi:hypothetical protein
MGFDAKQFNKRMAGDMRKDESGQSGYDPLGLFSKGGIFGGPQDHPADAAQADFLKRMMGREGELYPILKDLLSKSTGNAQEAYDASVGEANKLYPDTMKGVADFQMAPETLDALNKIKTERFGNIDADVNSLIKSKIAGYAGAGVTSADTAAGTNRNADLAMQPVKSQAEIDYQNSLLTMPGDVAMKKYGLATAQGGLKSAALKDKYQSVLNPYLDMWRTAGGIGSGAPATQPNNSANAIGQIASMIGSFTNQPKKTGTDYGYDPNNYVMQNRGN